MADKRSISSNDVADIPTGAQLKWAGRVWDASLRRDCEGFLWQAFGYQVLCESHGVLTWEQVGIANQLEITRTLLRLEQYFIRGHR